MNKKELLKWLFVPVKDIPPNILPILEEYGFDIINEDFSLEEYFIDLLCKRKFKIFPIEGLNLFKDLFKELENEIQDAKKIINSKKRKEKLIQIKRILETINNNEPLHNEIFELEIKKHRPFLSEYINIINLELKEKTTDKPKVKFWKPNNQNCLNKFFELLNIYEYIEKISKDIFIKHFDGTATPETQKINWIDEQTVFIRLFDKINFCINNKFLFTTNKTVSVLELSKHFTINGAETNSKNLRQTRNTIKGIETKKELEINNISKELKLFSRQSIDCINPVE